MRSFIQPMVSEEARIEVSTDRVKSKYDTQNEDDSSSIAKDSSQSQSSHSQNQSPANGQRQPAATQKGPAAFLSFLERNSEGKWKPRFNKKGELFRVSGGRVPEVGFSLDAVKELAGNLAGELGIPKEQVTTKVETQDLRSTKIYDAVQTYKDMDVFQSWMRIMTNQKTGDAFLINNQLKVLEEDINLDLNFDFADAQDVLMSHYGSDFKGIDRKIGPVIFADKSPHQMAYVFHVRTENDVIRTVVGAQDQRVLLEESIPLHK